MKAMGTSLRARRAPFGFPTEGALGPGKMRLPSKVLAIIETAIKKIYLTDVAAVIEPFDTIGVPLCSLGRGLDLSRRATPNCSWLLRCQHRRPFETTHAP